MTEFEQLRDATGEYGVVEELRHPLAFIKGLPQVSIGEIILFEMGGVGQVIGLDNDRVEVMVLFRERMVPGTQVVRTGKQMSVRISESLRGHAINPLGESLFFDQPMEYGEDVEERLIDIAPPHISSRRAIRKQLSTGTSVIDLLLTLGKGQREAVMGDPTTGKGSFLLTTVQSHAEHGIVIYAAIGKPWNDVKKVYNFCAQKAKTENIIIVATSAEDVLSTIFLTPFVAMTLAEYWRDKGEDVLVILDDLSTHARFYREIGLLGKRFPARESYPADIFYVHARLLERAGNFYHEEKGEASITCLPVGETVNGDLTGYIVSNLISITDGHLLFDEAIFSQGRRPAINIPLSVTRVGGSTRTNLLRELHRKLTALLSRHEDAQRFTHFGAELNENLKRILEAGDRLHEFLSQPLFVAVPFPVQVIIGSMIWLGWMNGQGGNVAQWRECLSHAYYTDPKVKKLVDMLMEAENLDLFAAEMKKRKDEILALCQLTKTTTKK